MSDAQSRRVGQALELSEINELDSMALAAELGSVVWDHLESGNEVILVNQNPTRSDV